MSRSLQRRPLIARAFAVAARLADRMAQWPNRMTPPAFRLLQIGSAFWQSRALYVAARLDVASVMAEAPCTVETLATRVGADAAALARLLRMLAAMGVFEEVSPGVYRNNKLSNGLRTDQQPNVRAMVLMHNSPEMSAPWFNTLEASIRTGSVPFQSQHGQELFDYMDSHPAFDALFAEAMDSVEALTGDSFATEFDWSTFDRLIDVGGSKGTKAMAILKRHPHLHAVVVDRASTIEAAQRDWAAQQTKAKTADLDACLARMRFEVGDARHSLPSARNDRDAYLLSAVLHGFDDPTALTILRQVATAAKPAQARIILLEMVMPAQQADFTLASFDMQMFMGTRGRERTHAEWQALFTQANLTLTEVVQLASFGKMMVLKG
ncbi:MAG: methyltransferase [Leptothrix ochracea]|uniref:methyltransferase n=1 Tax=Leptothrix ochracea TaxID=735331 RepID=UPI0034E20F9E